MITVHVWNAILGNFFLFSLRFSTFNMITENVTFSSFHRNHSKGTFYSTPLLRTETLPMGSRCSNTHLLSLATYIPERISFFEHFFLNSPDAQFGHLNLLEGILLYSIICVTYVELFSKNSPWIFLQVKACDQEF